MHQRLSTPGEEKTFEAEVVMYRLLGNRSLLERKLCTWLHQSQSTASVSISLQVPHNTGDAGSSCRLFVQDIRLSVRHCAGSIVSSPWWRLLLALVITSNLIAIAIARPNIPVSEMNEFDRVLANLEAPHSCDIHAICPGAAVV